MAGSSDDDDFKPPGLMEIISSKFLKPATPKSGSPPTRAPDRILHGAERKAAMRTLDATEMKWSKAGLILSALLGVAIPVIVASQHKTTKVVGNNASTAVTPDALLLGGVVLLFCLLGAVAFHRRRRSLLAFAFFVVGFALSLLTSLVTILPLGLAIIVLGGWLMLRAWRLQKYGTTNAKQVAREAATRPSRKVRQQAAKTPVKPTGHKAPTANKRYTPKAPSKKKIPKPAPDG
jgi:hypothetical protein